jgi:serine phosphatase RsbU (regulator of sigma subunit)
MHLASGHRSSGNVLLYGPAPGRPGGWVNAQLRPLVTAHRQQIDQSARGAITAQPGFSGTPVVDAVTEQVLGLIVATAVGRDASDVYAIPLASIVSAWPAVFAPVPQSPYKGLHAFESTDRELFFGRVQGVEQLVQAVSAHGLVPVVGASGVGKSSIVGAGLVPRLDDLQTGWGFVTIRPRPTLLLALAVGLARASGSSVPVSATEVDAWQDRLSNRGLADAAQLACAASGKESLLVIIDQFEEVLAQDCGTLLQQFAELPDRGKLTAVLTLREDSFGTFFVRHVAFGEQLRRNAVALRGMDAGELEEAVRAPAALRSVQITDGLVNELVGTVLDRPGALPLLEFCLDQMWRTLPPGQRTLSFEAYEEIGRLDGALAAHADRVFDGLTEPEQAVARRLFVSHLTSPADADVRQVLRRPDCSSADWEIVVRLANERLVTIARAEDGQETAEVVHEALLRAWGRLRSWLHAEKPFHEWRQLLRYAMTQWKQAAGGGALLTGSLLAASQRWLTERATDLDPEDRRFIELSMTRDMLDGAFTPIGGSLDLDRIIESLMNVLVPRFCSSGALLLLENLLSSDEFSAHAPNDPAGAQDVLRRVAMVHADQNPAWDQLFPTGEIFSFQSGSIYADCISSGITVHWDCLSKDQTDQFARGIVRQSVSELLNEVSILLIPIAINDVRIGFFECIRLTEDRSFDSDDIKIGSEFASRAASFIDNARRYNREHATGLTLQRSLLPTGLSAPSSVEIAHRYLPASQVIEVGGDWYDSIALPGARAGLIIGDVAGHGVRAAATMGRLRVAIQTLTMLELTPAAALSQLDELMGTLSESEPYFATCAYAIFDAITGTCEIASAGHLPPLLVHPDGTSEYLDITPAPPLGIGDAAIPSNEFTIEDGSLLVLFTNGLVEKRGHDLDEGLVQLQMAFGVNSASLRLEDLIRGALSHGDFDSHRDDIAVLMARLRRLPADQHITWTVEDGESPISQTRARVRGWVKKWKLNPLADTAELLVSELVTNATKYAPGHHIQVRLIVDGTLICEVTDNSPAMPRVLEINDSGENGRGLHVVARLASRWGSRRTPSGKVVWCELIPPDDWSIDHVEDRDPFSLLSTITRPSNRTRRSKLSQRYSGARPAPRG